MSWFRAFARRHYLLVALASLVLAMAACSGGVAVAQGIGGGPLPTDAKTLQWVVGLLIGVVMFLLGGATGNLLSLKRLDEHTALDGHPAMVQRVSENGRDIKDLRAALIRIEAKLDRVIERQAGAP